MYMCEYIHSLCVPTCTYMFVGIAHVQIRRACVGLYMHTSCIYLVQHMPQVVHMAMAWTTCTCTKATHNTSPSKQSIDYG